MYKETEQYTPKRRGAEKELPEGYTPQRGEVGRETEKITPEAVQEKRRSFIERLTSRAKGLFSRREQAEASMKTVDSEATFNENEKESLGRIEAEAGDIAQGGREIFQEPGAGGEDAQRERLEWRKSMMYALGEELRKIEEALAEFDNEEKGLREKAQKERDEAYKLQPHHGGVNPYSAEGATMLNRRELALKRAEDLERSAEGWKAGHREQFNELINKRTAIEHQLEKV
ncbi:MAG: hypothetical protein HY001_03020 [Candidatus Portnoybacteria bacterium]|nr:hypothetical protein [Candidatus Portnoybacteria bacterium]